MNEQPPRIFFPSFSIFRCMCFCVCVQRKIPLGWVIKTESTSRQLRHSTPATMCSIISTLNYIIGRCLQPFCWVTAYYFDNSRVSDCCSYNNGKCVSDLLSFCVYWGHTYLSSLSKLIVTRFRLNLLAL